MAADMAAQPATLAALVDARARIVGSLRSTLRPPPAGAVIVGRGSSDYAAVFGRYALEAAIGRPVALAAPSLTTLYDVELDLRGWLAVGVSQSGRTPEVAAVLSAYADAGARTVAITNERESPLARAADAVVELGAGVEAAVPATKTFTAELVAFALIAEALGRTGLMASAWSALPDAVARLLADPEPAELAAARLADAAGLACVARGHLLCIALEAAFKLREAAGLRAEGWSAADFRHGPVTVAGADLPLLAVSAAGPAAADVAELADRLERTGTPVLRLSPSAIADLPLDPSLPEPLATVPAAVRAQQLALALALRRGVNPDRPPGLSKVTPTA
ncbi:MAG: SIS domain-containing protein [Solirubrobacterales bacterium]|nr:SIS domain-containing protein [Solirubrobacterales bacterium]